VRIASHATAPQSANLASAKNASDLATFQSTLANASREGGADRVGVICISSARSSKSLIEVGSQRHEAEPTLCTENEGGSLASRDTVGVFSPPESVKGSSIPDSSQTFMCRKPALDPGLETAKTSRGPALTRVPESEMAASEDTGYGGRRGRKPIAKPTAVLAKYRTSERTIQTVSSSDRGADHQSDVNLATAFIQNCLAVPSEESSTQFRLKTSRPNDVSSLASPCVGGKSIQNENHSSRLQADGGGVSGPPTNFDGESAVVSTSRSASDGPAGSTTDLPNVPIAASDKKPLTATTVDLASIMPQPIENQVAGEQSANPYPPETAGRRVDQQGLWNNSESAGSESRNPLAMSVFAGAMVSESANSANPTAKIPNCKSSLSISSRAHGTESTINCSTEKANKLVNATTQLAVESPLGGTRGVQHWQPASEGMVTSSMQAPDGRVLQTQQTAGVKLASNSPMTERGSKLQSEIHAPDGSGAEPPARKAFVDTARVIQSLGQTEMHFGIRSSEFGTISIRTSVTQQQTLAQISVDHGDLRQAILNHIATSQAKIAGDTGLQVSIQMRDQGSQLSSGSQHTQREGQGDSNRPGLNLADEEPDVGVSPGVFSAPLDGRRLDIRA
jgi:hypothetical protein